jgi:hypothetical protein
MNRPAALACRRDPDRWFDRADRTHALRHCLQCPARGWCAAQALTTRAPWGMWAGVWIDGRFEEAAGHLASVAADPPAPLVAAPWSPTPPSVAAGVPSRGSAAAELIAARSAGHCEIMTPDCRFGYDLLASRIPGVAPTGSAAVGYAVCRSCATVLDRREPDWVRDMGYVVESAVAVEAVPFFWRHSRWMRLCADGRLRAPTRKAA